MNNLLKKFQQSTYLLQFFKKIILILIIQHFLACMYYLVVQINTQDAIYEYLQQLNGLDSYIYCFYFSATLIFTIGYGDRTATTNESRIFFIIFTFVNIIIYGYVIADFSSIFYDYFEQQRTLAHKRQ